MTPREAAVLDLIVKGFTSKAAGTALRISARTVEFHRANIMAKLAAGNVADLARIVAGRTGFAEETTHETPPSSQHLHSADERVSAPKVTTADRYHFHLTDGDQTLLDHVGIELASVSEARQRATANGQLVVQNLHAVVKVTDGADKLVLFAPLSLAATTFNFEKSSTGDAGREGWFATSEVPLHNSAGQVIGLAGVTGDVIVDKQLLLDQMHQRDTMSYALAEMSDGLAMFDAQGRLEFCNEQYRACFPLTGHLRQPGVHLREVLQAVVETGEQITAPQGNGSAWIETIVANLKVESEEEINLADGRWLQHRTRPTSAGSTMVVVTDVTRMKLAELALHTTTHQLKHLVRTDSLTDLLNRRAFDEAIEAEIRRSARAATPLSLLLIDVDHFKDYNDRYGYPAGDECLRRVSQYLKASLKRPADTAARYDGEEFTTILPDTDEEGAFFVAEGFRRALAEAQLPHETSERGYVTASVGVATYMPNNVHRDALELIRSADEALYRAKGAGRDRVFRTRIAGKDRRSSAA